MVVIGVLYVDVVAIFGSWRWMTVLCIFVCAVWALLLLAIPETPAFLMSRRKLDDARRALIVSQNSNRVTGKLSCNL